MKKSVKIGVLALQGAFREHIQCLQKLNGKFDFEIEAVEVKRVSHLHDLDGLIIPGGESTAMSVISNLSQCHKELRHDDDVNVLQGICNSYLKTKKPIWGTCAGAILLAKEIEHIDPEFMSKDNKLLGQMDVLISRNYFGRQLQSFEQSIHVHLEGKELEFPGVFIRAPAILKTQANVKVLATLPDIRDEKKVIVAAQQDHILATVFHPELTDNLFFHEYFVKMIVNDYYKV
jgi:5'-phosphate synthase pdxT subunit